MLHTKSYDCPMHVHEPYIDGPCTESMYDDLSCQEPNLRTVFLSVKAVVHSPRIRKV